MPGICIEKVAVVKLFNRFSYEVSFKNEDNVSIFIAPNGYGKTTILNFLRFLFSPNPETLFSITHVPFAKFVCKLSKGTTIEFTKSYQSAETKKQGHHHFLLSNSDKPNSKMSCTLINNMRNYDFRVAVKRPFKKNQNFDFSSQSRIFWNQAKDLKPWSDLMRQGNEGFSSLLNSDMPYALKQEEMAVLYAELSFICMSFASFLDKAIDYIPVSFISTKRLLGYHIGNLSAHVFNGIPATYKAKVVEETDTDDVLINASAVIMSTIENAYTEHAKLTLIYDKLKLFAKIFSERNEITHKTVRISRETGIEILQDGEPIDIHLLSSGEKNDFMMFFQLIFDSVPGGIVLIDEPEISWHIEWQLDFLDRLLEICKMNHLQAIVTTHSPSIVNEHTDLFAKKKEIKE